ncbi:LysE family translocator [Labrys sp. KNU-23]|uniref:LysE family translocator n=1 Tax=Labrys sp. KNU-23 TaxID=2789216 RepID=UPI0011EBD8C9|nr:LysE family translocator [Labrys sp. KNU-23]QEN88819.1 LysE family translocator [Labrys sp. KNU-23]
MLDPTALAVYAGALFVAAALPGPGIAALVARVLGKGARESLGFAVGIALGDLVWLGFAAAGLAVLAQSFSGVFLVIKYAGVAYLLYLAWKLWTTANLVQAVDRDTSRENGWRSFLGGLSITLGNPKVMVFYTALLPNLIDLGHLSPANFVELAIATETVLAAVFAFYIALAGRARSLLTSPRAMRLLARSCGTIIAGTAVTIATR